jgi:hypothetical protein
VIAVGEFARIEQRTSWPIMEARKGRLTVELSPPNVWSDFEKFTDTAGKAGATDRGGDVPELSCQVEVAEVEVFHRALEHDDAEVLARIDTAEQVLQTLIHCVVDNIEGGIVEYHSPVGGSLLDHPQRGRYRSHD